MEIKLEEVLKNFKTDYEKLTAELSNPEIFSDIEKTQKLLKKHKQLEEIIKKYERLEKISKELKGLEEIISQEKNSDMLELAGKEIKNVRQQKEKLENEIKNDLSPASALDSKDIIVEIRAGAGGEEAAMFAADLFRMYAKFAEKNKWQTRLLDSSPSSTGGLKEVVFEINGADVYGAMKYESGVHRVQRIPITEKSGRVHTSTATVAVLAQAEEEEIFIKPQDIRIDTFRSGGPGGQSVNKTESAVRITYLPSGLIVKCQDEKSQHKNKERALKILRSKLLAQEEEKREKEERKTRKTQIGTGDRSEKIRTYNFPQNRVTDHRIKKSWQDLDKILEGNIGDIVNSVKSEAEK
ncbi:peptide chain release factor 1 [Patescibacteria group bacterium]|nr:peptide chain release factor 1 [Patescibacteria group bacterium]MBU3999571.1 peptide chain release factor 1 [Patescibacteria group bacterium]MBU4056954.1 peptide chain release factor 1 [Patescibacteria group bacterium]